MAAKRKEFVARRKVLIDEQESENQVRDALAKAEEFMAILKKLYSNSTAQSLERLFTESQSVPKNLPPAPAKDLPTPTKASPTKVVTSKASPSKVPLPDSPLRPVLRVTSTQAHTGGH